MASTVACIFHHTPTYRVKILTRDVVYENIQSHLEILRIKLFCRAPSQFVPHLMDDDKVAGY